MAGRRSKLTAEVHGQIVAYVRAGAFDWVAAEAAGIGKSTYYRWLQRGEEENRGVYHEFRQAVREARAQARVAAETEVRREQPLAWLRYGPGRARPDEPGWTESHEVTARIETLPDPRLEEFSDEQIEHIARLASSTLEGTEPPPAQ